MVEGAGDDPDAHVVGGERRRVDRSPPVRAGRLVEDPGVQRGPPQQWTTAASGSTTTRSERTVARSTPSTHSRRGRSNVHGLVGDPAHVRSAGAARGCRSAAGAAPASGRASPIAASTSTTSARPSFGWARGATSQRAEAVDVHHREQRPAPPRPAGDDVGDRAPRRRRPARRAARRSAAGAPWTRRPAAPPSVAQQVAAAHAHRAVRPPLEVGGERGVGRRRRRGRRGRRRPRPSPRPCGSSIRCIRRDRRRTSPDLAATPTTESATTPRNACSATSAARAARGRVGRDDGDLAGQVDELLHRAHEVATGQLLVADDLGEPLAGDPAVRGGDEAGIGRAVLGEAARPLVGGEVVARTRRCAASAAGRPFDGNHGGGGGSGLRCSYTNTDSSPASVAASSAVEHAAEQALGDQQVGLVEQARQHVAAARSAPTRRRRRSPAGRARRARGRTRERATGRARRRATSSSTSSRSRRSVWPAARIRWRRSGSDSTGWAPSDTGRRRRPWSDGRSVVPLQRAGDLAAVLVAVRAEHGRQAHRARAGAARRRSRRPSASAGRRASSRS